MLATVTYDVALISDIGQRGTQEDALAARFSEQPLAGYVIISDGMGGHNAGDVASELVVRTWRETLDPLFENETVSSASFHDALPIAALRANEELSEKSKQDETIAHSGATMLGLIFLETGLSWISIGDSPLYLFRNQALSQINEDHSMAPLIDAKVAEGLLSEDEGKNHPDRNQLTSVISGYPIPKVDCPETPLVLQDADLILAASDGLQYITDASIEAILKSLGTKATAQEIGDALLEGVKIKASPDQDNLSIVVVKSMNPKH